MNGGPQKIHLPSCQKKVRCVHMQKEGPLLFKNLEKGVEDELIRIYDSIDKQVFIAYDKQGTVGLQLEKH